MSEHDSSKRQFIKAAAYVAPVILTLKATPSFAGIGSIDDRSSELGNGNNGLGNSPTVGNAKSRSLKLNRAVSRHFKVRKHDN